MKGAFVRRRSDGGAAPLNFIPMVKPLRSPFLWVPTLYLAMGIPFNVIMSGTAANMYKSLGYSNAEITIALGSIGVAWSLKPLWAAFLEVYFTKKIWVLAMEALLAGLFVAVAMTIPGEGFFKISLSLLWVAAFASSTQDICADGIYLTALDRQAQSKYAGIQGMFWVTGKVVATGIFVAAMSMAGEKFGWSQIRVWQGVMFACAGAMGLLFAYHYWFLPTGSVPAKSRVPTSGTETLTEIGRAMVATRLSRKETLRAVVMEFGRAAVTFFHKRAFWGMIAFVCLYRLGEGLILMEGQLFLRSATAEGGLGLTAGQVSQIDAVYGTIASIAGGLLGGWFVGKRGLSQSLWILALCLNIPHLTYVALSHVAAEGQGASYSFIASMVSIEKFGYGFGMVGNMIYMMQQLAPGRRTMTHYAFATALMNLMLVPTNMISGPLAELLGFSTFFIVVMAASVPSVWAAFKAPFPLKAEEEKVTADATGNSGEVITVDDPTRLSAGERSVQAIAGRASMFTVFNVLSILVLDAMILGWLHGVAHGSATGFIPGLFLKVAAWIPGVAAAPGEVFFTVLVGCALLKGYLTWRTISISREAFAEAAKHGEVNYRGNARGALVATAVCAILSAVVLYFGAKLAF